MHVAILVVLMALLVPEVAGHGRLVEPPSRASMWRFGYNNPPNYSDSGLFCGGASVQWQQNGGKCGVCGDNYAGPHDHEVGGKYANGVIVRKYDMGQVIDVGVHLTANHKGYFEFRLCESNDAAEKVEQDCFDEHLLEDESGNTRFTITMGMETLDYKLKLPDGVRCTACVFQWKYRTGNSWGTDPQTGQGCIGCGAQEQFQACADVSIDEDNVVVGEMTEEVEVPSNDDDERNWREKPSPCVELGYGAKVTSGAGVLMSGFVSSVIVLTVFLVNFFHRC